ncbi:sodium:solute symporter family protein [Tichowtungia aerotolerans]|uniref:Na+:solute symporter n=1 Tax=Tichowtungia aerotolerans TaxID=2697043 RepID=A0A6P1M5T6_9BACT|nr:sodium:solute symporter family protein [Tichowtungia aerotolerans]QHI68363.1 Na+:solute symporter [Tichowtungia aerotolerans]
MTGIDWVIIGLYCAGLLAVGVIFARSNKNASDMFVAGRSSPWWLSGVSAYMTMFSAGTFVVWGGITYEFGLVGAVICSMYGIAAFLAGRFFAGKWHDTNLSTAAEFVNVRFSKKAFNFYTVYRGIYLAMSGLSLYALAVMLCPLMPLPDGHFLQNPETGALSIDWTCAILAAIVVGYTMIGGLWAVLMTDMLQFIVLSLCVVVVVPMIVTQAGGLEQITANVPEGFLKPTAPGYSWFVLGGWMLVNCFQLGAEWHFIQRHLCVPSAKDAKKGMYLFGWLYLVTPFLWMAPPLIYRSMVPDADPQEAYILACKSVLPVGMIGMMVAAMFSATASSLSSVLNVFAGVLTDDVYRRLRPDATDAQTLRAGRIFTVLIGIYILAGALILPRLGSYRDIVILVGSLIGPAILLPTIWALFSNRIGAGVVWATLVGGVGAGVLLKFGFSADGWFSGTEALSGMVEYVSTHPRESDLFVGVLVPLLILLVAELRGTSHCPEWQRLQEATAAAVVDDAPPPASSSRLPSQVMAGSLGILGLAMLILIPLSGDQWKPLAAMATLLLILSAAFVVHLRRSEKS